MEKGQILSKANKEMHRFISVHSFAVLVVPILLSMLFVEKGQILSKANKEMHRFISVHSFAVLVVPILLSMLVFNHLKKKKKGTEKLSASFMSPVPTGGSDPYDVFLSFRGSDTRKGFTDHLYHSLANAGTLPIYVFKDDNSLPIGEEFGSQLLDAITRSKISIPIISENYASSKWCIRELIHIMECKNSMSHIVLPIFYKVDPSNVRYLQGNFGRAFHSRKKNLDAKDILKGQQALKAVSLLNGIESEKIANGHEAELVEKVVKIVLSKLRPDFRLDVTKHLIGIDGHVKKMRNWIDNPTSDARMIGIYGMGGVGKTTLAKVIYNELSNDFVHRSFLPDIRETACNKGIPYLQNQLIKEMQPIEPGVWRKDDGVNLIKSRFKGKQVLILLDDIDHNNHLHYLARERNWFASGSIIIVTTRNKAVLDQAGFKVDFPYELNEIDRDHSLTLFNRHAFGTDHSPRGFEDLSHNIVDTLNGLPLALEVLGSYLYGKTDQKVWDDMLNQLKEHLHKDVKKILKISYDALEDGHQEIFLEIACFFIGKESKFAIYMWGDCHFYASQAIDELKLRCLIKVGDDGKLRMHDQLRDLGRSIIRQGQQPEKYGKLWVCKEPSIEEKGTEGIQENYPEECYDDHLQTYKDEEFQNLQSSRFHQLRWTDLSGDTNKRLSELRWLQLLDIEPNQSFPATNLHLPKLVVLQLSCNQIIEDWRGWSLVMVAKRLKVLDLACCEHLRCTPDFSAFIKLEMLILKKCQRLEEVHPSIGRVKSLISLDLSECGSLKQLPEEVGELENLKELILDFAGITEIPTSIGSLTKLEKLVARGCRSLLEIPSSIWDLLNLQHLDISESAIEKLPSAIRRLEKPYLLAFTELKIVILKDCYRLKQVQSIGKVKSLVSLDLSGCSSLNELPGEVGKLEELKELILDSAGITVIPPSIGSLSKLEKLSARCCLSLREIPSSIGDLENLQQLDISESAIEKLPNAIGKLTKLRRLSLDFCLSLKGKIPSEIGNLSSLEILQLTGAPISDLPESIKNLSSLRHISLEGCNKLWSLPELPSGLKYLRVSCRSPRLPQLPCLIHLETLHISWKRSP